VLGKLLVVELDGLVFEFGQHSDEELLVTWFC
jgi:hypothetical protein